MEADLAALVQDYSEDCLFMNIYAGTKCTAQHPCTVVFYIHGGGFAYDTPSLFTDKGLAGEYSNHDLVFVLPSYRLGILGFVDFGDYLPDAPYNLGFLGNVRDIVLFTHSSAATAGCAILASPLYEVRAFSRAIVMSPTFLGIPHVNRAKTEFVLKEVGCMINATSNRPLSPAEKMECMRSKSVRELIQASVLTEHKYPAKYIGLNSDGFGVSDWDIAGFVANWKPLPLLVSITSKEADFDDPCAAYTGFFCPDNREQCTAECERLYLNSSMPPVSAGVVQAMAWFLARLNRRLGQTSYFQVFDEWHANTHARELMFAFDLHASLYMRTDYPGHLLMRTDFPAQLRRFIKTGTPAQGIALSEDECGVAEWLPMDENGRNYFYNNYETKGPPTNFTVTQRPEMRVGRLFNKANNDFWITRVGHLDHFLELGTSSASQTTTQCPYTTTPWWAVYVTAGVTLVLLVELALICSLHFIRKGGFHNKKSKNDVTAT